MARVRSLYAVDGLSARVGRLVGTLFASSLMLSLVLPMLACPAAADGFSVRYDTALDAWNTLSEEEQFCIINYQDGVEKMIVQIQLDQEEARSSSKIAWLFPVPSAPETVSLRHFQTVPRLDGEPLGSVMLDELVDDPIWSVPYATQLYPIPLAMLYVVASQGYGASSGSTEGVQSFALLEQYGVTTEVLAVDSVEALNEHLSEKNITLPTEADSAVDGYLGGDYSFVLSWISNVTDFLSDAIIMPGTFGYSIGVGVEFPCDEMFFPLRMTSAYGSMDVPITVQVLDFVTPDRYPSSRSLDYSCKYRVQDAYSPIYPDSLWGSQYSWVAPRLNQTAAADEYYYFFAEQISEQGAERLQGLEYTVVTLEGPAEGLSEDLWMVESSPLGTSAVAYLRDNPWPIVLMVFAAVSCASSLIACSAVFGYDRRVGRAYFLLGLFNVFTIIGYTLAFHKLVAPRVNEIDGAVDKLEGGLLRFALTYSVIFLSMTLAAHVWLIAIAA